MGIFTEIAALRPLVAYLLLFCFFMGLTLTASFAIQRFTEFQMRQRHNEIAGFFFGVIGVVYGVLLAFITVAVWEKYNTATENVNRETTAARLMYRNLNLCEDQGTAEKIEQQLQAYVHAVVEKEFPAMAKMKKSPATDKAMDDLWANMKKLKPKRSYEQSQYDEILNNLNKICHFRNERLETAINSKLVGVMRFIVILGALITLFFAVVFAAENFWWHITMTALLALLLCTILFILLELGHPFLSGTPVHPDGYIELLEIMKSAD
jgi:hypothetical protein